MATQFELRHGLRIYISNRLDHYEIEPAAVERRLRWPEGQLTRWLEPPEPEAVPDVTVRLDLQVGDRVLGVVLDPEGTPSAGREADVTALGNHAHHPSPRRPGERELAREIRELDGATVASRRQELNDGISELLQEAGRRIKLSHKYGGLTKEVTLEAELVLQLAVRAMMRNDQGGGDAE